MPPTLHDSDAPSSVPTRSPALATGVELLGEVEGSGYRQSPALVRRADGQVLQLTPLLYAVLGAVDGRRTVRAIADELVERQGVAIDPDDIEHLLQMKLRPLGVLQGDDGTDPEVQRSNPLLALRGRVVAVSPERTQRLAARFAGLFAAGVVAVVLTAFVVMTGWLLLDKGLASATRQALYEPSLLLLVIGLTLVSGAFHELGHAAACRRGGAEPGVMGMGIYIVWPAFYTDVSDSYRLDRRSRLRVDVGGLYFNAVFTVGLFVLWGLTGADALLLVVPLELLQMLRQLVPLVRFDGYHILADVTGVPDLFARIKPTLLGLWPTHWGSAESKALKPWARAVITVWVLVVVPLLALSLVLMVVALPRLAATAWDSLVLQASAVRDHWANGRLARIGLGAFSVVAIALPMMAVSLLLTRVARRTSQRLWRATDDDPPRRAALVLAGGALVFALGSAWWPDGQYRPITRDERGTLVDGLRAIRNERGEPVPPAAGSRVRADLDGRPGSAVRTGPGADGDESVVAAAVPGDAAAPGRARHAFTAPRPPGDGDNQALVENYVDRAVEAEMADSLVFVSDGEVANRNQAYALASCADCDTVAVAFQVVLVVGDSDRLAPVNEAVAVNHTCERCDTSAIAMQTVLSVPDPPTDAELDRLDALWARVEAIRRAIEGTTPDQVLSQLSAIEAEIIGLFGPDVEQLGRDHDRDIAEPDDGTAPVDAPGDPEPTPTTTTTTAAAPTTSTTAPPSTTTTTTAPTTTTTAPTTDP